ncbi:MAG: hypothetical protein KAG14_03995 [Mycoplasmataceae bacterium]|nr:hypothetical protein [Mycoplasmataceae bacterium]
MDAIKAKLSIISSGFPKSQLPSLFKDAKKDTIKTLSITHGTSHHPVTVQITLEARDKYGELVITSTIADRTTPLKHIVITGFDNSSSTILEKGIKDTVNPLLSQPINRKDLSASAEVERLPSFITVRGNVVVALVYQIDSELGNIQISASVIGSDGFFSWNVAGYKTSRDSLVGKTDAQLLKIFNKHLRAAGLTDTSLDKGRLPSEIQASEIPASVSFDEHLTHSGTASTTLTGIEKNWKSFFIAPGYFLLVNPSGVIKLYHVGAKTPLTDVSGSHKIQLIKYLGNNKFAAFSSDSDSPTDIDKVAYMTFDSSHGTVSITGVSDELALPKHISSVMEVNTNEFVGNDVNGKAQLFRLDPSNTNKQITFKDISSNVGKHSFANQVVYQDSNIILLKETSGTTLFIGKFNPKTNTYESTGKTIPGSSSDTIIPVRGTSMLFVIGNHKLRLIDTRTGTSKNTLKVIAEISNNIFTGDISQQDVIKFNNNQYGFVINGKLYEVDVKTISSHVTMSLFKDAKTNTAKEILTGITGHVSIQTGEHEYLIGDALQKISIDRGSFGQFTSQTITKHSFDEGSAAQVEGKVRTRGYITLSVTLTMSDGTIKTITKVIDGFKQKIIENQNDLISKYTFTGNTKDLKITKDPSFIIPTHLKVKFAVVDPHNPKPAVWMEMGAFIAELAKATQTSGEIDKRWIKMKYVADTNYVFSDSSTSQNPTETPITTNVLNYVFNDDVQQLLANIGVTGDTAHAAFSGIDDKLFKAALYSRHISLQYSTDDGATWIEANALSATQALLNKFGGPQQDKWAFESQDHDGLKLKFKLVPKAGYTLQSSTVLESNSKAQTIPVFIYTADVFNKDGFNVAGTTSSPLFDYAYKNKDAMIRNAGYGTEAKLQVLVSFNQGNPITDTIAKGIGFSSAADARLKHVKPWMTESEFLALFSKNNLNIGNQKISAKIGLLPTVAVHTYVLENQHPQPASEHGIIKLLDIHELTELLKPTNSGTIQYTGSLSSLILQLPRELFPATLAAYGRDSGDTTLANIGLRLQYTTHRDGTGWTSISEGMVTGGKLKVSIKDIVVASPYIKYRFMAIQTNNGVPSKPALKESFVTLKKGAQNDRTAHESIEVVGDLSTVKAEIQRDHTLLSAIALSGDMNALSIDETAVVQGAVSTQKIVSGNLETIIGNTVILYKLAATGAPDIWLKKDDFIKMLKESIEFIAKHNQDHSYITYPTLPTYIEATKYSDFKTYLSSTSIESFNPDAITAKFGLDPLSSDLILNTFAINDKIPLSLKAAAAGVGIVIDTTSLIKELNELVLKGNTHKLDAKTIEKLNLLLNKAKNLGFEVSYAAITKTGALYDQTKLVAATWVVLNPKTDHSTDFVSIGNDKGMVFRIKYTKHLNKGDHGAVPFYALSGSGTQNIFAKSGVTNIIDHAKLTVLSRGVSNAFAATTSSLLKYKELDESILKGVVITGAINNLAILNVQLPPEGIEEVFSFRTKATSAIKQKPTSGIGGKYNLKEFIALLSGGLTSDGNHIIWKDGKNKGKIVPGAKLADINFLYKNIDKDDIRVEFRAKAGWELKNIDPNHSGYPVFEYKPNTSGATNFRSLTEPVDNANSLTDFIKYITMNHNSDTHTAKFTFPDNFDYTTLSELGLKLQIWTGTTTQDTSTNWFDLKSSNFDELTHLFTLPLSRHINPVNKVIKFRFVKLSSTSITVPGTIIEPTLSPNGENIASEAKTWVDTSTLPLENLAFTGDSMHLEFTKSSFENDLNSNGGLGNAGTLSGKYIDLRFSLTSFQDITDTLAQALGFADKAAVPELKKSMSILELKTFFNAHPGFNMYLPQTSNNEWRDLKVKIVSADNDHSVTSIIKSIQFDSFVTAHGEHLKRAIDTSEFDKLIRTKIGTHEGIGISGSTIELISKLPDSLLTTWLNKYKLKLQWSYKGTSGGTQTVDGRVVNPPTVPKTEWIDVPAGKTFTSIDKVSAKTKFIAYRITSSAVDGDSFKLWHMSGTEVPTHAYQLDARGIKKAFHIKNSWLSRLKFTGDSRNLVLNPNSKIGDPKTFADVHGINEAPTTIRVMDPTSGYADFNLEITYKLTTSSATGAHEIIGTFGEIKAALTAGEISYTDGTSQNTEEIDFRTYILKAQYSLSNKDSLKFSITDDSSQPWVTLDTDTPKWIDVQQQLDELLKLKITGDSEHLAIPGSAAGSLAAIIKELQDKYLSTNIKIIATSTLKNGNPDWTSGVAVEDRLPDRIFDSKKIWFKIVALHNTDFFVSTEKTKTNKEPIVELLVDVPTFVDVDVTDLSRVTITGSTRNPVINIPDNLLFQKDGVLVNKAVHGAEKAVEVFMSIAATTKVTNNGNVNTAWMKSDLFKMYLEKRIKWDPTHKDAQNPNGQAYYEAGSSKTKVYIDHSLGFTSLNVVPPYTNVWYATDIRVKYGALSGYKINVGHIHATKPNIAGLKTFIDVSEVEKLIGDKATDVSVIHLDKTLYEDTEHVHIVIPASLKTLLNDLGLKLQWNIEGNIWTDDVPNRVNVLHGSRKLNIKIVPKTTNIEINYKVDGNQGKKDDVAISKTSPIDISIKIAQIPENVDVSSVNLAKIILAGLTDSIRISDADSTIGRTVDVAKKTNLKYSLTGFKEIIVGNAFNSDPEVQRLVTKFGWNSINDAKGIKASMTKAELMAFINGNNDPDPIKLIAKHNIYRTWVSVRLEHMPGFSIYTSDAYDSHDGAIHSCITEQTIIGLFYHKDVTSIADKLSLKEVIGTGEVNLYGQSGVDGGVVMELPESLSASELLKLGLKLQIAQTTALGEADWKDVITGMLDASGNLISKNIPANTVSGQPHEVPFGVVLTIKPEQAFEKVVLRLVPIMDEKLIASPSNTKPTTYAEYENAVHVRLTDSAAHNHNIDTSKLPVVITVDTNVMKTTITLTGTTHDIVISGEQALKTAIDAANPGIPSASKAIDILYSIGTMNGKEEIWLHSQDFVKYLNGTYTLKDGTALIPNYKTLNPANIQVKLGAHPIRISPTKVINYIPSNPTPVHVTTNSVKKWIDVSEFMNALAALHATGTTKQFTYHLPTNSILSLSNLQKIGLKLQWTVNDPATGGQFNDGWLNSFIDKKLPFVNQNSKNIWYRIVSTNTAVNKLSNPDATQKIDMSLVKIYVEVLHRKLDGMNDLIKGSIFKIIDENAQGDQTAKIAAGLDESQIDTDSGKFSLVHIEYLYGGRWLDKSALLAKLKKVRTDWIAGTSRIPSDFDRGNIKVKWVLDNAVGYVIGEQDNVNVLHGANQVQRTEYTLTRTPFLKHYVDISRYEVPVQGKNYDELLSSIHAVSGSINNAVITLKGILVKKDEEVPTTLASLGLKIQISTASVLSSAYPGAGWSDVIVDSAGNIHISGKINTNDRKLWIRFVPINDEYEFSSINNGAIRVAKVDVSQLKYEIRVHNDALKETGIYNHLNFFVGTTHSISFIENNILEKAVVTSTDASRLHLEFQVISNRNVQDPANHNNNLYIKGNTYSFKSYALLQAALNKGLNFSKESLEVKLFANSDEDTAIDSPAYQAALGDSATKDSATNGNYMWVKPNIAGISQFEYTEDYVTLSSINIVVSGNNLKFNVDIPDALQKILVDNGWTLEYSIDAKQDGTIADNAAWTAVKPEKLHEDKALFIRLAPTAKHTISFASSGSFHAYDGSQVLKLHTNNIKIAVIMTPEFLRQLATIKIDGTAETSGVVFHYKPLTGSVVDTRPPLPQSQDGLHISYKYLVARRDHSATSTSYESTLSGAVGDDAQTTLSVSAFNRDRDEALMVRLFSENSEFEMTNDKGDLIPVEKLTTKVLIDKLTQTISTTKKLNSKLLNGAKPLSWREWANRKEFLPSFNENANHKADLEDIKYAGQGILHHTPNDGYPMDAFDIGLNPYIPNEWAQRVDINSLAPRHTHFVFSIKQSETGGFSASTESLVGGLITSTKYKGLRIELVADDGYKLEAGSSWERDFYIVYTADTTNLRHGDITYEGFKRKVKSNDGDGHIGTDPTATPSEIYIHFKDKDGKQVLDTLPEQKAFVLEWGVFDSAHNPVAWTDDAKFTGTGWHIAHGTPTGTDPTPPPSSGYPFLGHLPISLKNGYKVEVRMRARDGYFIVDNDVNAPHVNTQTGYRDYSHPIVFADVSGLKEAINLPKNLVFKENSESHTVGEPTYKFTGNEGRGKLQINYSGMADASKMNVKVQWFRPYHPPGQTGPYLDLISLLPKYGMEMYIGKDLITHKNIFIKVASVDINGVLNYDSNINLMREDSFFAPSELNELSVGDTVKFRFEAKDTFAFRWEDQIKTYTDIQIPKTLSEKIYTRDKFGEKVAGLTILPVIRKDLKVIYLANGNNKNAYNGDAKITLNQLPSLTNKWKWHTRIVKPDGTVIENDRFNIRPENVVVGYKMIFTVRPISSAYKLDHEFNNEDHVFIVEGLRTKIDTSDVSRPIITFSGANGAGTISTLTAGNGPTGMPGTKYDNTKKDKNGFPLIGSTHDLGEGVKWVFSVSKTDPNSLSADQLSKIKTSDVVPKNLKIGQWIKVSLEPNIPLINGIEPPIFSEPSSTQVESKLKGWIQVTSLFVDPGEVGLSKKIVGATNNNRLVAKFIKETASEEVLRLWVKKSGGNWVKVNKMTNLDNGDKLTFRAELVNGVTIDPDPTVSTWFIVENGKTYLQKPSWKDWTVNGIKTLIDVSGINIVAPTFINAPDVPKVLKDEFPDAKAEDIFNGYANLLGTEKILTSIMKAKATYENNGIQEPASDKIRIEYILSKYNPGSGSYTSSAPSLKPPTHLSIGDKVTIQVVPVDKENFILSIPIRIQLIVKDLLTSTNVINEIPPVVFTGENGEGIVAVTDEAPVGFKWEYQVYDSKKAIISGPKTLWLSIPPSDLRNQQFVKVRIVSNNEFAKKTDGHSIESGFIEVVGLSRVINGKDISLDKSAFKVDGIKDTDGELKIVKPAQNGIRYTYEVVKKNKDGTKTRSIIQHSPPEHLSNGDVVIISIESDNDDVSIHGSKSIEFEINGLEKIESKSASSRLLTIMLVVGGITLALITAGGIFFIKRRKINKLG